MALHETTGISGKDTQLSDYEIERGKPMPNIIHGTIQNRIGSILFIHYGDKFIFPNELSLATTPISTPDICIYPKKKLRLRDVEAKETEMPLTTIEILSPSQTLEELQEKIWSIYFPMGVKSAWIVVPELKAVQLLLPNEEERLFYKEILIDPATDIQIQLEKVFEDLV